jgi:hypothetical protein
MFKTSIPKQIFTRNPTVILNWLSDKWFGRNLPKTGRTILRDHRQQQNIEAKGNIKVVSSEIILFHHPRIQYCLHLRFFVAFSALGESYIRTSSFWRIATKPFVGQPI